MNRARAALRRRGHLAAGARVLLAALALGGSARGESARRVVLVVPEAPGAVATEALARVRGELGAARFEVETEVVGNNVDRRATVERALRKADARAAFGIFFGSGVAEIWVSDSITGRTVVQTLPLSAAAPERRASVLAVKAVDLLKATLAEVWVAGPSVAPPASAAPPPPTPAAPRAPEPAAPPVPRSPPSPSPPPPIEAPAAVAPPPTERPPVATIDRASPSGDGARRLEPAEASPPSRFEIAAGVAWLGAPSAGGLVPLLGLSWFQGRLGGRLTASALGSTPQLGSGNSAGSARGTSALAIGEFAGRLPLGRHFDFRAGLGAGAYRIAIDGASAPEFQGNSGTFWSLVVGGGAGGALTLGRVAIALDARLLGAATSTYVRVGEETVVRAGWPLYWIGGSVGARL